MPSPGIVKSMFENGPCMLVKDGYFVVVGAVFHMLSLSHVSQPSYVYTDFCGLILPVTKRAVLKHPTNIVDLSVSPFSTVNF